MAECSDQDKVLIVDTVHYTEDSNQSIILMDAVSGDFFGLDSSAAVIWRALEESHSIDAAIDAVVGDFQVDRKTATKDVQAFVEELVTAGFVVLKGG